MTDAARKRPKKRGTVNKKMAHEMKCTPSTIFGEVATGVHALRVPGTDAAAADYILTLLLAWALSAAFQWDLVLVTIALFTLAVFLHWWFCIKYR